MGLEVELKLAGEVVGAVVEGAARDLRGWSEGRWDPVPVRAEAASGRGDKK